MAVSHRRRATIACCGGMALSIALLSGLGAWRPAAAPARAQDAVTVSYSAGWNLVSGPAGAQLPGVRGDLLELSPDGSGYTAVAADAAVIAGEGYWAFFPADTQVSLAPDNPGMTELDVTPGTWTLIGNPGSRPVRLSGVSAAYGYDPASGYMPLSVLPPGRGAIVLPDASGAMALAPIVNEITFVALPSSTAANQFVSGTPVASPPAATPTTLASGGGDVAVIQAGFGQAKAGAPVAVAALLQSTGGPTDGVPLSITVYDATGAVVAAGDTTLRYLGAGETTGFVHRLTAASGGSAARVAVVAGGGKPAGDPPSGALGFGQVSLTAGHSGLEATAVLSSSFADDLSDVHVSAIAYDASGAIDGGGETTKRVVPAGGSVGVVVSIDTSGTPASVQFYAQLP